MRLNLFAGLLVYVLASLGCSDPPRLYAEGPPDAATPDPDPNHCRPDDFTCVRRAGGLDVASLGIPYDPNVQDRDSGPDDWAPLYGTAPRYIAYVNADQTIDLLWLDDIAKSPKVFQLHLRRGAFDYQVTSALELKSAGRVLGFTKDEPSGLFYFVTSIAEDLSVAFTPEKLHRPDIVKMIQYAADGTIRKTWDLGQLRGQQYPMSLPLYSPMVASSSRILFGGGKVATLFGVNTEVDMSIMRRHQMARYMEIDVASDKIDREAGIWVSHSFDQRLFFDGSGFIELHLGDAYPRDVVLGHHVIGAPAGMAINALGIKGNEGDNNTFSRLGGLSRVGPSSYLVLFITESTDGTGIVKGLMRVAGPRNLGLARVLVDTAMPDDAFGTPYNVTATDNMGMKPMPVTSHVDWLTSSTDPNVQVERPRIAHLAPNKNVIIYESWTRPGDGASKYAYMGLQALLVDDAGKIVKTPYTPMDPTARIPRGDDLYVVDKKALWFSGDVLTKTIFAYTLDSELWMEKVAVR